MVSMTTEVPLIFPQWQAPKEVVAYTSTLLGGVSEKPFSSLNIASHVGDSDDAVRTNRMRLPYAERIHWLDQSHGDSVILLPSADTEGDAVISHSSQSFCAVMTADCVPVLLCDNNAMVVAAVHAGWKGLHNGLIQKTINAMESLPSELHAWIGPAISVDCYEVDVDMAEQFKHYPDAIVAHRLPDKAYLNLPLIAQSQCKAAGVGHISVSRLCTYQQSSLFFSHRRASQAGQTQTGRVVSVIGLSGSNGC